MRQNFQPEQIEQPIPVVATVESTQEQSLASDPQAQTELMESLLLSLKRQSSRHTWFGGIATLLVTLFGFSLLVGLGIYLTMSHLEGHAAKLMVDFSLTSFGVTGKNGAGQSEMTVSGILPLLLLCGSGVFASLARRERLKLTSALAQYEDVRAVGPLVEALYLRDKSVRSEAAAALKRLLPRLRREDAPLLDSSQRLMLSFYLGRSRWSLLQDDDELSVAILQAYSVIGDGTELPTVKRLAHGKSSASRGGGVREAAQKYLDEVERRKADEQLAQTLLRPASANAVASDNLLRPATGGTESDPQQLLRASSPDENQGRSLG